MGKYYDAKNKSHRTNLLKFVWAFLPEEEFEEYNIDEEQASYEELKDDGRLAMFCSDFEEVVKKDVIDPLYPDSKYIWLRFRYAEDDLMHFYPIADHMEYPALDGDGCTVYSTIEFSVREKKFFTKMLRDAIVEHHSPKERKVILSYAKAIDRETLHFVEDVIHEREDGPKFAVIGYLSDEAKVKIEKVLGDAGLDFAPKCVIDADAIRHILKRHGSNGEADQSMADIADIARMPYVYANFDEVSFNGTRSHKFSTAKGMDAPHIVLSKKIDGKYYIVEAVTDAKAMKSYVVTAYIRKA